MTDWNEVFSNPSEPAKKTKRGAPAKPSTWEFLFSKPHATAEPQSNPVAMSGRLGGVLPPTPKMQQTAASAQPVYSGISNVLGLANVPGGAAGAFIRDVQAHRPLGFGQPPGTNSAETHFGNLLMGSGGKHGPPGGQVAQAVNEYFPTSPSSMHQYSKETGPLAVAGSYFVKHPRQNAALDFAGRILDPGNKLAFGAVGDSASALKTGTRISARAIAKRIVKQYPGAISNPLVKHLSSAENLGDLNRFADVKSAAEDIGRLRGVDAQAHGAQAESAARDLANATRYADGMSQRAANQVFKGLTKGEQFALVDMIEGESPLWGKKLTPAQQAAKTKLMPRYDAYQQWRNRLDTATIKYNVADASRLKSGQNFFSRVGLLKDSADDEALPENQAFTDRFGGSGRTGVRKGSLGANVHRRYRSLREALRSGEQLDPEASPMRSFEMHVFARTQAARINEQLDRLQSLGLIIPKHRPVPGSIGMTTEVPQPHGFIDAANFDALKQFGSNITREAYVHPAVAYLINDVKQETGARNLLTSLLTTASSAGRAANRILSTFEVSDPLYHPIFNVSENIASEAPNIGKLAKGAASNKAIARAEEEGVHLPFARRQAAHLWGRPRRDLTPQERLQRTLLSPQHGVESMASAPLYGAIEPKMTTGAYEALKPRLGPAQAKIAVRGMVGEQENIAAGDREAAQILQFPAWTLSQLRRWPKAIAERPYLYNAPHNAVEDYNESRGRGRRAADECKIIPPIVLRKDQHGDTTVLNIPHPGNRPTSLLDSILKSDPKEAGFALVGSLNPLLQQVAYWGMTYLSSRQKADIADVAPQKSAMQIVLDAGKSLGAFSPVRSFTSTELTPERQQQQKQIINAFLYGHRRSRGLVQIRAYQRKAENAGNKAAADRLRAVGDALYNRMTERLQGEGFPAP